MESKGSWTTLIGGRSKFQSGMHLVVQFLLKRGGKPGLKKKTSVLRSTRRAPGTFPLPPSRAFLPRLSSIVCLVWLRGLLNN